MYHACSGKTSSLRFLQKKIKKYSILTLILAGLSILALIIIHLALTDIYHGEEDLGLEWSLLRIAAVVILTFIIFTMATLKQGLKMK